MASNRVRLVSDLRSLTVVSLDCPVAFFMKADSPASTTSRPYRNDRCDVLNTLCTPVISAFFNLAFKGSNLVFNKYYYYLYMQ